MNRVMAWLGSAACLGLALVSTANAQEKQSAQAKQPASHRMVIYNGPSRSVHYFTSAEASQADQAKLREAERNENVAAMSDQLHGLLRQYLVNETKVIAF